MDYVKEAFEFANRFRNVDTHEILGEAIYIGFVCKPIFNKLTWIKLNQQTVFIGPNGGGKSYIIKLLNNYLDHKNDLEYYASDDLFDFICLIGQYSLNEIIVTSFYSEHKKNTITPNDDPLHFEDSHRFHSLLSVLKNDNTLIDYGSLYYYYNTNFFLELELCGRLSIDNFHLDDKILNFFTDDLSPNGKASCENHRFFIDFDVLKDHLTSPLIDHTVRTIISGIIRSNNILDDVKRITSLLFIANDISLTKSNSTYDVLSILVDIAYLYSIPFHSLKQLFKRSSIIYSLRGKSDVNQFIRALDYDQNKNDVVKAINQWLIYLGLDFELSFATIRYKKQHSTDRLVVIYKNTNIFHEVSELSHGHSQLIELLFKLHFNSTYQELFIIENIESYLHPKLIFKTIEMIFLSTVNRQESHSITNIQPSLRGTKDSVIEFEPRNIIFETQSDIFIKSLQLLTARGKVDASKVSINYINHRSDSMSIKLLSNGDLSRPIPDEFIETSLDLVINRLNLN